MSDTTRLEERLATAWTDAPPQPPVGDRLAAGHRALRRRRVLSTAATTLAVVAVVGVATAVTGGPGGSRAAEPAAPTASATPTTVQDPAAVLGDRWAGFDDEGTLVVRDDVDVRQSVEDSWQGVRWVALDLVRGDRTRWYFVSDDGSNPTVAVPPKEATPDTDAFLVWVQLQNPSPDPEAGADPAGVRFWVHLVADGRLVPVRHGVTVLRSVRDPEIPGFTDGTQVSVAAELRVDGDRYYVLARRFAEGPPDYFRISVRQGGPTLETMLDFARQKYGSGEGLR
jgi:hypothetical protein